MHDLTYVRATPDLPKVVELETCEFPLVEGVINEYKVLRLPDTLRRLFDNGASVVRINSIELAHLIPNYGGKGSGEQFSLLPHQDHFDPEGDLRRFLMLTKHTHGKRGSSTLVFYPSAASRALPVEEAWIKDDRLRTILASEQSYDERFRITKEQYCRCFEKGGYERVVADVLGPAASARRALAVRLGILGYLIRGPHVDEILLEVLQACRGHYIEERWERAGVLILDNPKVFHARYGGNQPALQRNFCT